MKAGWSKNGGTTENDGTTSRRLTVAKIASRPVPVEELAYWGYSGSTTMRLQPSSRSNAEAMSGCP